MEHPIPEPPQFIIPLWFYPVVVVIVLVILATKMPRYKSLFAKISFTVFLATIGLILGLGYFKDFPGMVSGLMIGVIPSLILGKLLPSRREKNNQNQR